MLQLHGSESPLRVKEIKVRYGLSVMKALPVRETTDLGRVLDYASVADRLLFDAKPPKSAELPGGNGVAFDWRLLAGVDPAIGYMLSGGLNAANIAEALSVARPAGIDISSGVESAPGVKDVRLIEAFFRAVAGARKNRAA
jgi:phosphoribosylanthranilate isomerase